MRARVLAALEPVVLACVPVALALAAFFQFDQTALLTFAVAVGALAVFFAGWEASSPALRQVMPAAVLGALAAAGRILFAPVPDVKPVSAICILAGAVFGRRVGFMTGALAALTSNFFFGQGAWTPWQMYAWGLVGYLAGVLSERGAFETREDAPRRAVVCAYGFLSALLYGALLNTWTLVGFVHPLTWEAALLTYGAGLPFDLVHAVSTVAFLLVIYVPWKKKLDRVRTKYALR
ncbi:MULTISPECIES: ECF transporter S component [unclassified Adlercreutzia]|uniref:ECF transporter S component n=1 Tax=unclassified Adlercreutzia TaxID=2636013 RepID=UPI0013EAE8CD|nr:MULTISPECIES: ECF transporter S component [unclassified Adlercreutzia]